MNKNRRNLCIPMAGLGASLFGAVALADPQDFEWSSTTGFVSSAHKEAIETITGQVAIPIGTPLGVRWVVPGTMSGTFTYDPDSILSTEPRLNALAYKGPNMNWTSVLHAGGAEIGTYSGPVGEVIVGNGDGLPGSGPDDLVNVHACGPDCGDGAGFTVGDWTGTGSSVVWVGEGFTEDQTLPRTLPPAGAPRPLAMFSFFNSGTQENVNIITIEIDIQSAVQQVDIDVKPGDGNNCFNVNGHGVIPVAILGSDTLDVTSIDASSLSFGGLRVRVRGNGYPQCNVHYANGDAYLDMLCQFVDDSSAWVAGTDDASLTGSLFDGSNFAGSDSICLVP